MMRAKLFSLLKSRIVGKFQFYSLKYSVKSLTFWPASECSDTSKLVTIAGNASGTLVTGDEAQETMRRGKRNTINTIKYSVLYSPLSIEPYKPLNNGRNKYSSPTLLI